MVRPGDHPRHMRHNQPDKADASADGDAHADHHGHRNQNHQLDPPDVHADVARIIFPNGERVQFARIAEDHAPANQQRQRQNAGMRVPRAGERAHRPKRDGAHLIVEKRQNQVDDAGNEHRKNHADEDDAVRRQRMIQRVGEGENQHQRQKRKRHRHEHRTAVFRAGHGDAQRQRDDRAQRRAGGHAQRRTIRQRVAQKPLHRRAAQRERRADQRDVEHARQAHVENDVFGNARGHLFPQQRAENGSQRVFRRDGNAADADAQQHNRKQRKNKEGIGFEGKAVGHKNENLFLFQATN